MGYFKMPTIAIVDGFQILLYTHEHMPPHVHVRKDGAELRVLIGLTASLWSITSGDPSNREVRRAVAAVQRHLEACNDTWRRIHGPK